MKRALLFLVAIVTAAATLRAQSEEMRDTWQRVADLFAGAGVRAGARVADVGAGDGYLTVRLAKAVGPSGTVYAVDTDAKVLDGLRQRLAAAGITNVEPVAGKDDDPRVPAGVLDGAIVLNAYHEMTNGVTVLRHLHDALKPGGRIVLCEPTPRKPDLSRAAQMADHTIEPSLVLDDLRAAGFEIVARQDLFATNLGGTHFGFISARRP